MIEQRQIEAGDGAHARVFPVIVVGQCNSHASTCGNDRCARLDQMTMRVFERRYRAFAQQIVGENFRYQQVGRAMQIALDIE